MSQESVPQSRRVQEPDPHHPPKELQCGGVAQAGKKGFPLLNFNASRQPERTFYTSTTLSPTGGDRENRSFPIYSRDMDTHSHGKTLLPTSVWAIGPSGEREHRVTAQKRLVWQIFIWV